MAEENTLYDFQHECGVCADYSHASGWRFCYVYLLHLKDEALDKFKVFKTEVELQQESLIKRFKTNMGEVLICPYTKSEVPGKRKLKVDGTVEKFKARLIIHGFKQKSGIDNFDTYAPVTRISTIRLLIAMTSIHNLIIHQIDVKIAFLNEELEEEVDLTKEFLSLRFSIKDTGKADVILGIRIKHESNGIAISQSHCIEKVLKKFNYSDCTPVSTHLDTCEKLMPNKGLAVSQLEYSRVIGCLMYATTCTRPDIAFAIEKLTTLKTIRLQVASAATLAKAYSQMYNGKSIHLGVRNNMIRELITNGVVSIEFVRYQQNLADYLTKGLARDLVIKSAEGMGLKST
nr:zinc finger, CCHC-type [Tanacetum cinerariifolium]